VTFNREEFEEDSDELGLWSRYQVGARSKAVNMRELQDKTIDGIVDTALSLVPAGSILNKATGKIAKFTPVQKGASEVLAALDRMSEVQDLVGGKILSAIKNELKFHFLNSQKLNELSCEIPARQWGPIDISSQAYSTSQYYSPLSEIGADDRDALAALLPAGDRPNDAIYRGFKLKALAGPGSGVVALRPSKQSFPPYDNYRNAALDHIVEVKPIEISLDPQAKRVTPGEQEVITIDVKNAVDKSITVKIIEGNANCEQISEAPDGRLRLMCNLGDDAERDFPLRLMVTSEATGGAVNPKLRQPTYGVYKADPTVRIEPEAACVKPKESRQLNAIVEGSTSTVEWSVSGDAKISASGSFSADKKGSYRVTAKLKDTPSITDTITIKVGACKCLWNASVGGPRPSSGFGYEGHAFLNELGMLSLSVANEQSYRFVLNAEVPFWGATGTFSAQGNAAPPGTGGVVDSYQAPVLLDNGELTPSSLTITSWQGSRIQGSYRGTGAFFASQFLPVPIATPISFDFDVFASYLESTNPIGGVADTLLNNCEE
jgi:hypothetical protein